MRKATFETGLIFSFFPLLLIMGNDLDIACFWFFLSVRKTLRNIGHFVEPVTAKCKPIAVYNSHRLLCNSHDRSNEPNLSLTLVNIWTSSKLMRVGGQTRARVGTLIHSHPCLIRPLCTLINFDSNFYENQKEFDQGRHVWDMILHLHELSSLFLWEQL